MYYIMVSDMMPSHEFALTAPRERGSMQIFVAAFALYVLNLMTLNFLLAFLFIKLTTTSGRPKRSQSVATTMVAAVLSGASETKQWK